MQYLKHIELFHILIIPYGIPFYLLKEYHLDYRGIPSAIKVIFSFIGYIKLKVKVKSLFF